MLVTPIANPSMTTAPLIAKAASSQSDGFAATLAQFNSESGSTVPNGNGQRTIAASTRPAEPNLTTSAVRVADHQPKSDKDTGAVPDTPTAILSTLLPGSIETAVVLRPTGAQTEDPIATTGAVPGAGPQPGQDSESDSLQAQPLEGATGKVPISAATIPNYASLGTEVQFPLFPQPSRKVDEQSAIDVAQARAEPADPRAAYSTDTQGIAPSEAAKSVISAAEENGVKLAELKIAGKPCGIETPTPSAPAEVAPASIREFNDCGIQNVPSKSSNRDSAPVDAPSPNPNHSLAAQLPGNSTKPIGKIESAERMNTMVRYDAVVGDEQGRTSSPQSGVLAQVPAKNAGSEIASPNSAKNSPLSPTLGKTGNTPTLVIANPPLSVFVSDQSANTPGAPSENYPAERVVKADTDGKVGNRDSDVSKAKSDAEHGEAPTRTDEAPATPLARTAASVVGTASVAPTEMNHSASVIHGNQQAVSDLPKPHQVLDANLPAVANPPTAARIITGQDGDLQMHVAVRTSAFGTVEIHTLVQQYQVGLAVNAERGLTHWLGPEVQSIASGLRDNHLNLASLEFNNTSGLQAGTSFHQQQSQARDFRSTAILATATTSGEAEPGEMSAETPLEVAESRVSIRV